MTTNEFIQPPPPDSEVFVIRHRAPSPPMISLFDPSPPPASKEPPPPSSGDNPPPSLDKKTPPASPPTAPESPPPSNYEDEKPSSDAIPPPPPPSADTNTPPSQPHQTPPIQENVPPPTTPPPIATNTPPTKTETPPTNTNEPIEEDPNAPPAVFESKVAPVSPDEGLPSPSPPLVSTPTPSGGETVTLAPPAQSSRLPKHSPPPPIASDHAHAHAHASASSNSNQMVMVVGLSIAGLLILAVLAACFLCCKKKKKQAYYYGNERQTQDQFHGTREWNSNRHSPGDHIVGIPQQPQGMMMMQSSGNYSNDYNSVNSGSHPAQTHSPLGSSQCQFSYEDLAAATGGFTKANLLGQGGFGYVHKGILPDGKVVAVKSLKSGSGQGEREFQAEVDIISRVHHRHLVSLVGYCITNESRMLVYEFVPNQTMEHHLHGKGQPVMDWSFRVRIAIGSAKGLAYLHEDCHPRIIHRDIKAANILLDENYEAMVADFGLAKLTTENDTHVSTRVMGTFGYLAPEYASSGKLSEKSDVFSFGVMLLELITGRRPVDLTGETMEDSLADWARPLLEQAMEDGNIDELVDPRLEGHYSPEEMNSMISCAAASIRHSGRRRPKMSQIVRALEGNSILVEETSQVPKKTGSIANGTTSHDTTYDTVAYNADMMKFRNMVMSSQDFGASSEFGDTSEYGVNPSITSSSSNISKEMGALNSGQHKIKYSSAAK